MSWLTEHFSLSGWAGLLEVDGGSLQVLVFELDWMHADGAHYYCLTLGLLGFCVSLTFWARGKYDETDGAGA